MNGVRTGNEPTNESTESRVHRANGFRTGTGTLSARRPRRRNCTEILRRKGLLCTLKIVLRLDIQHLSAATVTGIAHNTRDTRQSAATESEHFLRTGMLAGLKCRAGPAGIRTDGRRALRGSPCYSIRQRKARTDGRAWPDHCILTSMQMRRVDTSTWTVRLLIALPAEVARIEAFLIVSQSMSDAALCMGARDAQVKAPERTVVIQPPCPADRRMRPPAERSGEAHGRINRDSCELDRHQRSCAICPSYRRREKRTNRATSGAPALSPQRICHRSWIPLLIQKRASVEVMPEGEHVSAQATDAIMLASSQGCWLSIQEINGESNTCASSFGPRARPIFST